jgi:hypothetical protein
MASANPARDSNVTAARAIARMRMSDFPFLKTERMKSRPQWHKKGADQGRRPRLIMKVMKLPTYRRRCFPPVAGSPWNRRSLGLPRPGLLHARKPYFLPRTVKKRYAFMKAAPNPLGPWLGRLPCLGQTRKSRSVLRQEGRRFADRPRQTNQMVRGLLQGHSPDKLE